jgi:hypothetical protein
LAVQGIDRQGNGVKYAANVRNETEILPSACHSGSILRKKSQDKIEIATKASVKKEMARPRMAKSARISELKLKAARISKHPRASDAA